MLFKEAVSQRILELSQKHNYSLNKLAELSAIPPSSLRSIIYNQVENPSSHVIYKICKRLKMEIKDFYDSDLFNYSNLDD